MRKLYIALTFYFLVATLTVKGQDKPTQLDRLISFPDKLNRSLQQQQQKIHDGLDRQTEKYFQKLLRQEKRIKKKLEKTDSALAESVNLGSDSLYQTYLQLARDPGQVISGSTSYYSGRIDSMTTALNFMKQNQLLKGLSSEQYKQLVNQYGKLNSQLSQTEQLSQLVKQRKALLKEKLQGLPLGKVFTRYQKQAIYYQQQLNEYKAALENPAVMERKALEVLTNVPAFRKYFDKFSQLGSMFRLPGQMEDLDPAIALNGLQTRQSVFTELNNHLGGSANARQAIASGLQEGQGQLDALKTKLNNALNSGESLEMPGFTPNQQKTKSFLKRIELGTNFQNQRATSYWPVTSDLGLSVGYKLNNKSIVGVGTSYKVGWGKDIRHIQVTHQGLGVRTFLDIKIKKGFWATGGAEWNYRNHFENLTILKTIGRWQQSALIGVQKKYRIGKQSSTASVLYDFLWQQQVPQAQPVLFRIGYQLK